MRWITGFFRRQRDEILELVCAFCVLVILVAAFAVLLVGARGSDDPFATVRIGKEEAVGAFMPGMRFFEPTDRAREWIVIDTPPEVRERTPAEKAAGENWPAPAGKRCVNLASGEVRLFGWNDTVIRSR